MKLSKTLALIVASALLVSSLHAQQTITIDAESAKKSFSQTISVTPMDKTVKITKNTVVIAPKAEGITYTISGYFNGQIINKTKNTVLKLKDAYIENTAGDAAIYGEAKTEISTTNGTTNYIVASGKAKGDAKIGAIHGKKNLVLGGSGTLYVLGSVYHGVKADDEKIKGSGTLYLQGTQKGSGLNCDSLTVEKEKSFKAYFINSKNGVKAENTISIASGEFFFYNNETALKTDTKKDNPKEAHSITLSGGTFHNGANAEFHSTEKNAFSANGALIVNE